MQTIARIAGTASPRWLPGAGAARAVTCRADVSPCLRRGQWLGGRTLFLDNRQMREKVGF